MHKNILPIFAGAMLASSLMACEINIENPGVATNGATNGSTNGMPNGMTNGTPNGMTNGTPNGMTNGATNGMTNGSTNNANTNNNTTNTIANDTYPCSDTPEIPKEQCQGGVEWDAYEGDAAQIARGEYLALHVTACVDCHTPLTADFLPGPTCESWWSIRDCEKPLAGWNYPYIDVDPVEGLGAVGIPNLTPHPDGLGEYSPEDLRTAMTKGLRPEFVTDKPRIIFPLMPYYQFAHINVPDQDAIIAYLHSLPAIPSGAPPAGPYGREPFAAGTGFAKLDAIVPVDKDGDGEVDGLGPTPDAFMPGHSLQAGDADFDKAEEGRYLARIACATCHTPGYEPDPNMSDMDILNDYMWVDQGKALCGSDDTAIHLSSWWMGEAIYGPPFPVEIRAQNISGHATAGVGAWTVDELIRSVNGTDKDNEPMCPPMYTDTWFAEMTPEDKEAIAIYLKYSTPCDNDTSGMFFDCKIPAN